MALAATAAVAIVGCGSKGGPSLASINGETISMDDYYKTMEQMGNISVQTDQGPRTVPVAESLGFQALRSVVYNRILLQLAKDEGVYPSEEDIKKELEYRKKVDKSFGERLKQSGLTMDIVKRQIMLDLAQEKIITKGINVTIPDVDQYIKDNPKQFMEPATVDASWIFVTSDDKKQQVDQALGRGQGFSSVALQYSEAPQAKDLGGRFPIRALASITPPFDKPLKETREGTMSDWVKVDVGWAKFYVERRTAEKPMVIDDLLKVRVQRQLALQRGSLAVDLDRRVTDKILESEKTIKIEKSDLKEPWKRLIEELRKQRSTPMTGNTTPSTGTTTPAPSNN